MNEKLKEVISLIENYTGKKVVLEDLDFKSKNTDFKDQSGKAIKVGYLLTVDYVNDKGKHIKGECVVTDLKDENGHNKVQFIGDDNLESYVDFHKTKIKRTK